MPVTVTVYEPEAVPDGTLTVRVEVPVGVTMLGDSVAVGPAGDTVAARFTVPVKPEMLVTVTVDVTDEPGAVLKLDGLAEMLKPCGAICTWTVTLWEIEVPDPVTVAEPEVVPLTVSVVDTVPSAGRKRPVSEVPAVRPEVAVVAKLIKSLNPPKLVNVIVEVAGVPDGVWSDDGLAEIPKSVWLEKVALSVVSESGVEVPLETVTENRLIGVPGDNATTL